MFYCLESGLQLSPALSNLLHFFLQVEVKVNDLELLLVAIPENHLLFIEDIFK